MVNLSPFRRGSLRYGLLPLLLFFLSFAVAQDANAVWVVPISGEITPATAQFVMTRIERANETLPLALVFVINTPGGRVDAMETIVEGILQRAQVPTIAVVENAFSAGALIAMSAEQLVMLPGSSIGAALAVTLNPTSRTGMTAADEKVQSAMRSQFRSVAEARGRNPRVAEAMVSQAIEIPGLATSEELVTLTPAQALEHNIANLEARNLREALEALGYSSVRLERLEPTQSERIAGGLTSPLVAALLLAVGIIGILIEVFTPGFGVPGLVGALALALFFGGAFIATPAGAIDLVLLLLGVMLIAAEVFVIPGFGVAGVLGIGAIIFSVWRIFQDSALEVLSLSAIFGGALLGLALWLLPNTRIGSALTLTTRLVNDEDVLTTDLGDMKATDSLFYLSGQQGVALSDLRPAGVARFGEARVDVVTEGDFVTAGTTVNVLKVEGNRVTVRALEAADFAKL